MKISNDHNSKDNYEAQTLILNDSNGNELFCYLEQLVSVEGQEYALLTPVDTPVETPKPRPETVKIDPEPKPVETKEVEPLQTKDSSKQVKVIGDFSGKMEKVRTPASEKEIEVGYLVVDANKLKKASGDFQPRDRDLKESEIQINKIASDLDPNQLLESPTTNTGAPIISNNGTIISGNGRVLSLEKAKADFFLFFHYFVFIHFSLFLYC